MVSWVPTGTVSRRPGHPLGGGHADPVVALPAEHLSRLAGDVAQPGQHRSGGGQQPVLTGGRGQLAEPRSEDEAALQIAADQPMVLEGHRQPVGGRPGQPGRGHQSGQRGRSGLQGAQHQGGFVQHADTARVVHALILPSRMLECKSKISLSVAEIVRITGGRSWKRG